MTITGLENRTAALPPGQPTRFHCPSCRFVSDIPEDPLEQAEWHEKNIMHMLNHLTEAPGQNKH